MKYLALILLLVSTAISAQVKGRITSADGKPIAFVSITETGTNAGTATNVNGMYSLNLKKPGNYTMVLRATGYKTRTITADIEKMPHTADFSLQPEDYIPAQPLTKKDEAAAAIIEKAIAARKVNSAKTSRYTADFYSRGIFRIKETPDKILGQDVSGLVDAIDESGQGLVYLSETVSTIQYNDGDIKEHIIASKVSGDDGGFSFNNAASAEFDFYQNTLPFETHVISPVGAYGFNYYDYSIESTFTDSGNNIYKIKVNPKRNSEPAMEGFIYIADKSWALTAVDLSIEGSKIGQPLLDRVAIKQNFGYRKDIDAWVKNVQTIEFGADIMGIGYAGRFVFVSSNHNFKPEDTKQGNEVLTFAEDANQKDYAYWNSMRRIPLTTAEAKDYAAKEKIDELEKTEPYLDSIDKQRNRFKLLSPVIGYKYHNSFDNWQLRYSGIATKLGYNTVQGYNLAPEFYYVKENPEKQSTTTIGAQLSYGIAEQRFRAVGSIAHKFNSITNRTLTLSGGSSIEQFNPERPINRIVNSIATLFFRENYMKLYDRNFIRLAYEEEIVNGIQADAAVEYSRRHALFNNSNFSTLKDATKPFTSNNPLLPTVHDVPAFLEHHIVKASVGARITFGQKYWSRPDGKVNQPTAYPRLYLRYDKGFASTIDDYNFDHFSTRITYDVTLENKGDLGINLRAGKFFNSDNIALPDFRHFNGNQTNIGVSERYLNVFNLLPYYTHSTSDQYFEGHLEHNFKGYITNKIPLLNKLDYHLVVGYHVLSVPQWKPYHEVSIGLDNVGWGRFRYLRIDYVRSYESGFRTDGVIFGLEFLRIFE